ncbi:hypothetical protein [Streptacidiphilus rugosus]|uniref:hypothetical protein n=1 Tax=Streptacidiphilus rugosus TaxID=405783 RepID=UPI000A8E30AA|nr:hypothetical protein [Streptacidiphilus rugosus]
MFEYDAFKSRHAELVAQAAQDRLVREAQRAHKNRRDGESSRPRRGGSVRRVLHLAVH